MDLKAYLNQAVDLIQDWEASWGAFERHPALMLDDHAVAAALAAYADRLRGNYPFFHPRYAGQMLKPPHPAAIAGYVAAMCINPNNHALDGGPPTAEMEKEVVRRLAAMFHFPAETLGHLTSSGTIANLEALWIARELRPGQAVAVGEQAHYTHQRMGQVLGLETVPVAADADGRMRLDALEDVLKTGRVGTVVLTAGTTGLGLVDPISGAVALRARYGCRLHVDAAYGGFFSLLAWGAPGTLSDDVQAHFRAIADCDSVAIDPHKHGLQPYGCGAILFRDPSVGRFYRHDSPYTYFTSDALHLGEISLECSRAGAAAGAFWLTLQLLPLEAQTGLGPALAAGVRAAARWHELLAASDVLQPYARPELDIIAYAPRLGTAPASAVDAVSHDVFVRCMEDPDDPIFLSVLRVPSAGLQARAPAMPADQAQTRILRSVLMRPEQEAYVPHLHARVAAVTRRAMHAHMPQ